MRHHRCPQKCPLPRAKRGKLETLPAQSRKLDRKDGETKSLPARYSFTYVKNGDSLADCRPPFLGHAIDAEIAHQLITPRSDIS
jgi:hypothetical protein